MAYEIATNSLFKDVSGYSFPSYERELKTDVDLEALKDFTERFLQHHHRQVQKKDGLFEFLTPDILRGAGIEDRYSKVTCDRKAAIDNPALTFFALGQPFVDRMLKFCGDVSFGGYCAVKSIESRRVKPCRGVNFNFVVRGRIQREENEEFLFSLQPVFVRHDKTIDDKTAKASLDSYGGSVSQDICERQILSNIGADKAFDIAKTYLQEQIGESIWDWDEDVSLLNVAAVVLKNY